MHGCSKRKGPTTRRARRAGSLLCVGLSLTGLLVFSAAAPAATPAWAPSSELTLPANADAGSPDASLSRVACGSATSCTTTGSYIDADGAGRALVASKTGSTWSAAQELDLPANASTTDPDADPTALACAAAGACALGGAYIDDSGQAAAMVATQSGGAWSQATTLNLPVADAIPSVNSLACGTVGSCSLVGWYDIPDGTHAFIATLTGGVWSAATELEPPANAEEGGLHSVACSSDGSCAAVGSYKDDVGAYRAMVASQANGVWSAASELTLPAGANGTDPGASLNAVACGAAGSCTALGSYTDGSGGRRAMVAELTDGSWSSASEVALPTDAHASDPDAQVASVACGASASCAAIGSYLDDSSNTLRPMVVSRANGVWSAATPLALPADAHPTNPEASLNAVACGAAGSCAAAGSYVDASGALRPMAAYQSSAAWSPATSLELAANADPANPGAYVSSLACGAAASCTLAGSYDAVAGGSRAMVASAVPQDAAPPSQNPSPAPIAAATPAATRTPSKSSRPVVSLKTSRLRVAKRAVSVKLSCKALPCSGTIKLSRTAKGKTTVLATATYTIGRDKTKTVAVRLTKRGKAAFRRAHTHPVKVTLVISVMGAKTTSKSVVIR